MSRSLTITRRLVAAFALAAGLAVLTGTQARAAVSPTADTDGWYLYATSPDRLAGPTPVSDVVSSLQAARRSRAVSGTDGWYRYATSPERLTGPTPVSDVLDSLRVARPNESVGAAQIAATAGSLGVTRVAQTRHAAISTSTGFSFDWAAAGVGAGAAIGLVLLTLAGGLAFRRRGRLVI